VTDRPASEASPDGEIGAPLPDEEGGGVSDIIDIDDEGSSSLTVHTLRAAPQAARIRLDRFIVRSVANASRTRVQELIEAGGVTVNGSVVMKSGRLVLPGDVVVCTVPKPPPPDIVAEDIPLDIVFEDDDLIVVNKPAGMVSHPAFGNYTGTLVNALLWHTDALSTSRGAERAGLLHRLDKDTTGLLCVAKTDRAMTRLAVQFAAHTVDREYRAIVWGGFPTRQGTIDAPIGRHRSDRKKMAVVDEGKEARTDYEVLEDFGPLCLVRLRLHTGRTHQIRVHMAHERHPLFGDPTYGGRRIMYGAVTGPYKQFIEKLLTVLPRQALHARTLGFTHPVSGERMIFEAQLPGDMEQALAMLRDYFSG
jgi:23S rRNA pseudouridine1911/1915/1917 synthase